MRILNTTSHVAIGQAFLLATLLLVASILGLVPDRNEAVREGRTALAEAIAFNGVFTNARFHEDELVKIARSEPYFGISSPLGLD